MSETPGFENRCEKTLNEGRHVCLQMRGHEGECRANVNAPWPPVPATPLDIEACVAWLKQLEWWHGLSVDTTRESTLRDFHKQSVELARALVLALPSLLARHHGERTCHAEKNCGPHDAGCGKSIAVGEEYRCLDCDAVMHKDCLRAHCSADEKDATILLLQRTIRGRDDMLERICDEMSDVQEIATSGLAWLEDLRPVLHVGGTYGNAMCDEFTSPTDLHVKALLRFSAYLAARAAQPEETSADAE